MITEDETFEYLTFGGTFGRVFRLFFDRLDVFMGISLVFTIPYAILGTIFVTGLVTEADGFGEDFEAGHIPKLFIMFALDFLVYELACVIGQGAISIAVAEIYVGRRPGWGTCLKRSWTMGWALVSSSLLVHMPLFLCFVFLSVLVVLVLDGYVWGGTLLFGFLIICLVVTIYSYSGLILSGPAIVIENFRSPIKGMKRSWELSTGSRCYVLSTLIGLFIGRRLIVGLFGSVFGGWAREIFDVLSTVFYLPLQGIIETVIYLNLRIGRESMNQQILMGDLVNSEPPASRFRNDDPAASGYVPASALDYRHVPLLDEDEIQFSNVKETTMA